MSFSTPSIRYFRRQYAIALGREGSAPGDNQQKETAPVEELPTRLRCLGLSQGALDRGVSELLCCHEPSGGNRGTGGATRTLTPDYIPPGRPGYHGSPLDDMGTEPVGISGFSRLAGMSRNRLGREYGGPCRDRTYVQDIKSSKSSRLEPPQMTTLGLLH